MTTTASIVIPAHNEQRVVGRLLMALSADARPGELDVVVVANGCTDETASTASAFDGVRVIEAPIPSKNHALQLGDGAAAGFPRLYVDADVVMSTADVRALVERLAAPGVLAAAPARYLPMDGVAWPVRWYYDVWLRLPGVSSELYGRGVVGVSAAGHERVTNLPDVMSDDLVMATAFQRHEYEIVDSAGVVIRPPRRYGDLLRRRVRAMTGNRQFDAEDVSQNRAAPRTSLGDVGRLTARRPWIAPKAALFLATALLARVRARRALRRDDRNWLRDESSRT